MASLLLFPSVWIRRTLPLSVNVLLSSVATFCPHFLFTENSFDHLLRPSLKSAKSFDSFAILSSRNDPFLNIWSLPTPSFWVDLPWTVEKITPFVKTFDAVYPPSTSTSWRWNEGWAFMKGLRYSPLHVTEFYGEMQGKFKVGLARLNSHVVSRNSRFLLGCHHWC